MFGMPHPQPPHRKEVAMQVAQHEDKRFDRSLTPEEIPGGVVAAPPKAEALRFDVVYTLSEYLSLVGDHVAATLRRRPIAQRRRAAVLPLTAGLPLLAAAALAVPGWLAIALALAGLGALAMHPITTRFWVLAFGTPIFLLKKRRMPHCAFRIDGAGIERTSRTGTLVRAWSDVVAVRRYRCGYVLVFDKGAVPIPSRCLNKEQGKIFRRYIQALHVECLF